MKKYKLIVNLFLISLIILGIICVCLLINPLNYFLTAYKGFKDIVEATPSIGEEALNQSLGQLLQLIFCIVFCSSIIILSIVAITILNLKLTNTQRAEQKALKAEAQKQTQIERLEKKLEELKKD